MRAFVQNDEEQLILWSAGTVARRQDASERIEQLVTVVDWSVVIDLLRQRGLLSRLGPRLREFAAGRAGEEFSTSVTQALDAGRRQGVFLQAIATNVMAALADAAIRCTPLKGPALSEALYGDPGRRQSSDIDLLVERERLRDAVEVVCRFGYQTPSDHTDEHGLPLLHFALVHEQGQLPPVELHWRIHCYEQSFAGEQLLAPPGERADSWRPAPINELVALLLFYARDGFIDLPLATDLGACWDVHGASLESAALDDSISAYPELENVLLASAKAAERTVGLPFGRLTEREARLSTRGRMAVRLASPHPHVSRSQLYADMGLIDGLLAPPGGFKAFVKRQVIPPREVLHEQARKAQRQRAISRLGYAVRVLSRYGLTMTRLLRPPESIRPG